MNRITVSAAIAIIGSCAGSAWAQSNVTVYGVADAALVRESGGPAGSVTNIGPGVASGSSKAQKAAKYGTKCIDEAQFMALVR